MNQITWVKKMLKYNKIKKYYLISTLSASLYGVAYAAPIPGGTYTLFPGWNYIGRATVSATVQMPSNISTCTSKGYWFIPYSGWRIMSQPEQAVEISSDGVASGFKAQNGDVFLVFRGGSVQGQELNSSCQLSSISPGVWDNSGNYSVSPSMPISDWPKGYYGGVTNKSDIYYYRWQKTGMSLTSSVDTPIYVYVGPQAVVGQKYTLAPSQLQLQTSGVNTQYSSITGSLDIIVKKNPVCTVSVTPQNIDFGKINVTGITTATTSTLFSKKDQSLNINCDSPGADITISASSTDVSGGVGLPLKNNGVTQAFVRGFYVANQTDCLRQTDRIGIQDPREETKKVINNVPMGVTTVPLSWLLCGYANSPALGDYNTNITMQIDW